LSTNSRGAIELIEVDSVKGIKLISPTSILTSETGPAGGAPDKLPKLSNSSGDKRWESKVFFMGEGARKKNKK
jgi:hypothetical protein